MSLTRALATFASETSFDDLPDDAVEVAKLATLNIVGCCLGGYQTRIGRLHVEIAKDYGAGFPQATILGDGAKVSLPFAAYANGNLGFALDYEDMVFAVVHPGFATVAAGLGVGEHDGLSGRQLLTAIVIGYEVSTRIALSMQPSPARARRVWGQQFHPFASAVAAGRLFELTPEEMNVAFGIAATYATVPSVYKYFGPVRDTRPIREAKQGWGWVCMAGLMAADSARRGFRGGLDALDGDFGFWSMASSDRFEPARALAGLGDDWLIREIEYKIHPSIGINHPAYWATRQLVEEHDVRPDLVDTLTVTTPWGNLLDDRAPAGPVDAQFSLPFTVASTVLRRPLSPALYTDAARDDCALQALLGRTRVIHDAEADRAFCDEQRIIQTLVIALRDGRSLERSIEFPRDRPPYGRAELEAKFHALAEGVIDETGRADIIDAIGSLETLSDLGELAAQLH